MKSRKLALVLFTLAISAACVFAVSDKADKQVKAKTKPVPRNTKEYREGCRLYDSDSDSDCPYGIGDNRRTGWFTGWLDRRTQRRLGEVFKNHGMSFP